MKKLLVLATIAGVIGLSLVASFAIERQGPMVKPRKQEIRIINDTLQKIISAKNDKSQPANSLTQRYRVEFETTSRQRQFMIIEIQMNEKGEILKANIVSASKQSSGNVEVHDFVTECNSPCKKVCTHVVWLGPKGARVDFYFCWCCCRQTC